jgi:hypothetical protein
VTQYEPGDYVKVEFKHDISGESEWMWVKVDSCNDANRVVFGQLDSEPVLDHGQKLRRGSQLAVSFDNIREHKKPSQLGEASHERRRGLP